MLRPQNRTHTQTQAEAQAEAKEVQGEAKEVAARKVTDPVTKSAIVGHTLTTLGGSSMDELD